MFAFLLYLLCMPRDCFALALLIALHVNLGKLRLSFGRSGTHRTVSPWFASHNQFAYQTEGQPLSNLFLLGM